MNSHIESERIWSAIDRGPSAADRLLGDRVSFRVGDTFIDPRMSPRDQWTRIALMLRAGGYVVRRG